MLETDINKWLEIISGASHQKSEICKNTEFKANKGKNMHQIQVNFPFLKQTNKNLHLTLYLLLLVR